MSRNPNYSVRIKEENYKAFLQKTRRLFFDGSRCLPAVYINQTWKRKKNKRGKQESS
jgi:hypothetical protein